MLCFVPVLHRRVWYVCCYVRKKALFQCLQLLRGGIWVSGLMIVRVELSTMSGCKMCQPPW